MLIKSVQNISALHFERDTLGSILFQLILSAFPLYITASQKVIKTSAATWPEEGRYQGQEVAAAFPFSGRAMEVKERNNWGIFPELMVSVQEYFQVSLGK